MYALHFREKIRSLALLVKFLERFGEKKYEDRKFDQNTENMKSDKIWIFWSNAFHDPPKFTEASDWLKNSYYLFWMVIDEFTSI